MPRHIFLYDPPDRLVIGTVGQPGERTFFMQARSAGQLTSVVLEKAQVAALAERLDQLLDEVLRASGGTSSVPAVAPLELNATLRPEPIFEPRLGRSDSPGEGKPSDKPVEIPAHG